MVIYYITEVAYKTLPTDVLYSSVITHFSYCAGLSVLVKEISENVALSVEAKEDKLVYMEKAWDPDSQRMKL